MNKSSTTVPYREQEQFTRLPFGNSWVQIWFQWGSCCSIFSFLCIVLYIIVCPLVNFLLTIVLSVLVRFKASDYPVGIFSWATLREQYHRYRWCYNFHEDWFPLQRATNNHSQQTESVIYIIYYGFSLLHKFSLLLQTWMSAYILKTYRVYISVSQKR